MRQLTYVAAGLVEWRDVPDPELSDPAGALVRPLAVARCDLDRPMAVMGLFPGPFGLGHETVAEVVAIGPEVSQVRIGQRVLVPYQISCGACTACADRRYGGCRTYRGQVGAAFGFGPAGGGHGGGLSDLLPVPAADHLLISAPDGVAPETLCTLVDNGVDGYRTVASQLAATPGAEVLVVGGAAPSVSLFAVAAAVALGSRRVRYIDTDPAQCEAAARIGADAELQQGPWPRSFKRAPITVEATMDTDGLACTLRSTDDYGFCTSVAIHFAETTPLPLLHMYTKGITLHVSRADSRRFLPAVLDLVTSGRLDPGAVPTQTVSWDDAADAWLRPAIKLVVSRSA